MSSEFSEYKKEGEKRDWKVDFKIILPVNNYGHSNLIQSIPKVETAQMSTNIRIMNKQNDGVLLRNKKKGTTDTCNNMS